MCPYNVSIGELEHVIQCVWFERQLSSLVFTQRSHKQCCLCKQMTVKVYVSLSFYHWDTSILGVRLNNLCRFGILGYLTFGEIVQFKYFKQVFNAADVIPIRRCFHRILIRSLEGHHHHQRSLESGLWCNHGWKENIQSHLTRYISYSNRLCKNSSQYSTLFYTKNKVIVSSYGLCHRQGKGFRNRHSGILPQVNWAHTSFTQRAIIIISCK